MIQPDGSQLWINRPEQSDENARVDEKEESKATESMRNLTNTMFTTDLSQAELQVFRTNWQTRFAEYNRIAQNVSGAEVGAQSITFAPKPLKFEAGGQAEPMTELPTIKRTSAQPEVITPKTFVAAGGEYEAASLPTAVPTIARVKSNNVEAPKVFEGRYQDAPVETLPPSLRPGAGSQAASDSSKVAVPLRGSAPVDAPTNGSIIQTSLATSPLFTLLPPIKSTSERSPNGNGDSQVVPVSNGPVIVFQSSAVEPAVMRPLTTGQVEGSNPAHRVDGGPVLRPDGTPVLRADGSLVIRPDGAPILRPDGTTAPRTDNSVGGTIARVDDSAPRTTESLGASFRFSSIMSAFPLVTPGTKTTTDGTPLKVSDVSLTAGASLPRALSLVAQVDQPTVTGQTTYVEKPAAIKPLEVIPTVARTGSSGPTAEITSANAEAVPVVRTVGSMLPPLVAALPTSIERSVVAADPAKTTVTSPDVQVFRVTGPGSTSDIQVIRVASPTDTQSVPVSIGSLVGKQAEVLVPQNGGTGVSMPEVKPTIAFTGVSSLPTVISTGETAGRPQLQVLPGRLEAPAVSTASTVGVSGLTGNSTDAGTSVPVRPAGGLVRLLPPEITPGAAITSGTTTGGASIGGATKEVLTSPTVKAPQVFNAAGGEWDAPVMTNGSHIPAVSGSNLNGDKQPTSSRAAASTLPGLITDTTALPGSIPGTRTAGGAIGVTISGESATTTGTTVKPPFVSNGHEPMRTADGKLVAPQTTPAAPGTLPGILPRTDNPVPAATTGTRIAESLHASSPAESSPVPSTVKVFDSGARQLDPHYPGTKPGEVSITNGKVTDPANKLADPVSAPRAAEGTLPIVVKPGEPMPALKAVDNAGRAVVADLQQDTKSVAPGTTISFVATDKVCAPEKTASSLPAAATQAAAGKLPEARSSEVVITMGQAAGREIQNSINNSAGKAPVEADYTKLPAIIKNVDIKIAGTEGATISGAKVEANRSTSATEVKVASAEGSRTPAVSVSIEPARSAGTADSTKPGIANATTTADATKNSVTINDNSKTGSSPTAKADGSTAITREPGAPATKNTAVTAADVQPASSNTPKDRVIGVGTPGEGRSIKADATIDSRNNTPAASVAEGRNVSIKVDNATPGVRVESATDPRAIAGKGDINAEARTPVVKPDMPADNRGIIGGKQEIPLSTKGEIAADNRGILPASDKNTTDKNITDKDNDKKNGKKDKDDDKTHFVVVMENTKGRGRRPEVKPQPEKKDTKRSPRVQPQRRIKYIVKKGDTLESIAEIELKDARFSNLIIIINRGTIGFVFKNGKTEPVLRVGQALWLPTQTERDIYARSTLTYKRGTIPAADARQQEPTADAGETESVPQSQSEEIELPEVTIMNSPNQGVEPPSQATSVRLAPMIDKIRHAGRNQQVSLHELDYQLSQSRLLDKLNNMAANVSDSVFVEDQRPAVQPAKNPITILPGTPAGASEARNKGPKTQFPKFFGDELGPQSVIDKLAECCRMITDQTAGNTFNSSLQVEIEGEWTTVVSYEYRNGHGYRYTHFQATGSKPFPMDLPLPVVQEMAREDFTRNWSTYCREFSRQKSTAGQ